MASGHSFYEEEDAEQILRLASSHAPLGRVSRESLLATAAELGITESQLAEAEERWLEQKRHRDEIAEFERSQRSGFVSHLWTFVIVNLFLIGINLFTSTAHFWFVYPLLGWGIGLGVHAVATYSKASDMYQSAFKEWREERRKEREGA